MASLTTIPSSVLPLCVAEQAEFPLTKAQKTFNALIEKISSKRTVLADFRHSGRGNQGVIAIAASERNGKVVAARLVIACSAPLLANSRA